MPQRRSEAPGGTHAVSRYCTALDERLRRPEGRNGVLLRECTGCRSGASSGGDYGMPCAGLWLLGALRRPENVCQLDPIAGVKDHPLCFQ